MGRPSGGFIFAESPELPAPEARIIWRAELDPGTLRVWVEHDHGPSEDLMDPVILSPWLTIVAGSPAGEHAVLSDGWRRIRLDVERGSLATARPILLRYLLEGAKSAEPKLLPLRRLLHLYRCRRFAASLYPPEPRIDRWLNVLRVGDALAVGASHKEIARAIFGAVRVEKEWESRSDALRSRIRRLAGEARHMARGGFRSLLKSENAPEIKILER